jgi:hypothetical protein
MDAARYIRGLIMRRFRVLVEGEYCIETIGVVCGIFMEMFAAAFVSGRGIHEPACYVLSGGMWLGSCRSERGVNLNRLRE